MSSSDFLYNSDLYRSEDKGMVTGIGKSPTPPVLHLLRLTNSSVGRIRVFY